MSAQDPDVEYIRIVIEPRLPSLPDIERLKSGAVTLVSHAHPTVQVTTRFDDRVRALQYYEGICQELRKLGSGGAGVA